MATYGAGEESLSAYLRDIARIPLLTAEQELDLGRRVQAGDTTARADLVQANLRFVVRMARRYVASGMPLADLIAEGNLGLIKAAERFDPEAKRRFTTYAVWWIRQAIQAGIDNTGRTIRLPAEKNQAIGRMRAATEALRGDDGSQPSSEAVSRAARVQLKDVQPLLGMVSDTSSLDAPLVSGEGSVVDTVRDQQRTSPEASSFMALLRASIGAIVRTLKPREAYVLNRRYGLDGSVPATLRQVGREIGVSRERVRQIERDVLQRIRSNYPMLEAFAD